MAARQILGRWGYECGCDHCQGVYRVCLLCLAPKRPSGFSLDDECNWELYMAPPSERERLMQAIVRRGIRRICETTGKRWCGSRLVTSAEALTMLVERGILKGA
jgi:hypothetical protein